MKNRRPKSSFAHLGLVLAGLIACIGCGKGSVKVSSSDKKAFESATPEVKQAWDRTLAADKANDYLNTLALLDGMEQMQLSEPQKQTLAKERESFNQRIWDAAQKNDPAAVKAVQATQKSRKRTAPADGK